jgi:hypothetical protein
MLATPLLTYVAHFIFFERCLDSNPESYGRCKQTRNTNLVTHHILKSQQLDQVSALFNPSHLCGGQN